MSPRTESFMKELNALLKKYNAEIDVKDPYNGGSIEITLNSKYNPCTYECIENYECINLGSSHSPSKES